MKKLLLVALIGITASPIFCMPAGSGGKESAEPAKNAVQFFEDFKNLYQKQTTSAQKELADIVYALHLQQLMMAFDEATRNYKEVLNKTLPAHARSAMSKLQGFTLDNYTKISSTKTSAADLNKKIEGWADKLGELSFGNQLLFLEQIIAYMNKNNEEITASAAAPAGGPVFESAAAAK